MTKRIIEHEIKLEKSVKIILAVLAFGVLAHAFAPAFGIKEANAQSNCATPYDVQSSADDVISAVQSAKSSIESMIIIYSP